MSTPPASVIVVAAPSGAGKTTLVRRLLAHFEQLVFSVSWTTRPPRAGERAGIDYHFADRASFKRMIDAGEFLEWAEVHGALYGTARRDVEQQIARGADVLLDIDVQGAAQIRASRLPAVSVFIMPPSHEVLARRLRARGTDDERTIDKRLRNAAREVAEYIHFDHVVINDELERAFDELCGIVHAQRSRLAVREALAARIVAGFAGQGQDDRGR
ncbi:MAG: guanylate kinase [Acidobacteriota bacterium]|nr:MAG: guanylate kinase [Acidobacteriota bacterium]